LSPPAFANRVDRGGAAGRAADRGRPAKRAGQRARPLLRAADRMSPVVDTLTLTAEDAIGLIERAEISPSELHAAYLEAIGERDEELHCYLRTVAEAAGDGIPVALKDVISTRGVETTAGSRILAGYVPVFDATVAARRQAAELTLLGEDTTHEVTM